MKNNVTIDTYCSIDETIKQISFYRKYIHNASLGIDAGYSGCSCCGSSPELYMEGKLDSGITYEFLTELYILIKFPNADVKKEGINRLHTLKKYQHTNIQQILKAEGL